MSSTCILFGHALIVTYDEILALRRNKLQKLLCAVLLCTLSGFSMAGNLKPYPTVPTIFPPSFVGNDLPGMIKQLKSHSKELGLVKSEYVSSDIYRGQTEAISGAFNQLGKMIFVSPVSKTPFMAKQYNADTGNFILSISAHTVKGKYRNFALRSYSMSRDRTYQATNAYGATISVTESHQHYDMLAFEDNLLPDRIESMRSPLDPGDFHVFVPIPPAEAEQVANDLEVVFVCESIPPVMLSFDDRIAPRLDFNYDVNTNVDALTVVIEQLLVINGKTGKVYFAS